MTKLMHRLAVLLMVPLTAMPAFAATKKHAKKPPAKSSHKKKHQQVSGKAKGDMEARALIRKRAPFFLDQRFRDETLRLNKDGTFSREGQLGNANQGSWKVKQGKLMLKWSTGEEFGYRITFNGTTPVIAGTRPNKDKHYVIHSAD